ncbi:MAG: peptidoglycan-binding protein [Candidatus Colwellbacteria bacterium]|nr:peptidoglycan-binding protein [Candidatus Colwellbacteria bacterium]
MKKLITFGLSAATALSMTGGVLMPIAGAVTIAELQAQIATLTAQLAAMSGEDTSTTTCYNWSGSLTIGSTGPDVTTLQNYLTGTGHFTFSGGATGYFGSITQAAVAAWQAANGVAPAVGYWGPISQAKYTSMCSAAEEEEEAGDLEGGAGSVSDYEVDSSYSNEEVGEGEEDVIVYGLDIEVDDSSDIEVTAVAIDLDQNTANNDKFEDYADEVSVWLGDEEYARVDADEFDEDSAWRKTITLDNGAIIAAGETEGLRIAVSGVGNLDTNDFTETWDVEFDNIRFKDATGATISEDPGTNVVTFSFEDFATSADVVMKISSGDEDINTAHVIDISNTGETDDEPIMAFDLEVEGDSDLFLDDVQVEFTVTGAGHIDEMLSAVYLYMDGEKVKSENIPTDEETVVFDDMDLDLTAGETYSFVVKGDFLSTGGVLIDNGDTIACDIGTVERQAFDVEDEDGEDLANGDREGSADGEAHAVFDSGISVELVSIDKERTFVADAGGETDQGTYEIVFKVAAFGDNMYVDASQEDDNGADAAGQGVVYDINMSGGVATVSDDAFDVADTENLDQAGGEFWIEEDDDRTFTLTVTLTGDAAADGSYEVVLESINWIDATTAEAAGGVIDGDFVNYYNYNLGSYKTGSLFLNDM